MTDFSYADLSFDQLGHVRLNERSLRLVAFEGQTLLAIGTAGAASFFDAETVIRALHGNANILDLPLPEPVPVLILDEFDADDQTFLREFALGAETAYLKTLGPAGHPDVIVARAASLGFVVRGASAVRALEAEVREKARAENHARVLAEKAADLGQGFVVKPADESQPIELGVVRKCDPATYERIVRSAGGYSPAASRIRWPFNTMRVGDEIFIDAKLARRAQTAAHVYAARANWTFRTTLDRVTGVLRVIRTEDRPGMIPMPTKAERAQAL